MSFPKFRSGSRRKKTRASFRQPEVRAVTPSTPLAAQFIQAVASHPVRAAVLGIVGLGLVFFVSMTSLPLAISSTHPHLALFLSPDHPHALMTLAREERRLLFLETEAPNQEGEGAGQADTSVRNTKVQQIQATAPSPPVDPEVRGERIRDLATRVLAKEPLNAEAYRLLAEVEPDPDKARQYLVEALARSRRETVAAYMLMHQSYEANDAATVMRMADILMRTRPQLNPYTLTYLQSLVLSAEGREALAEALAQQPPWRMTFLRSLGTRLAAADDPLALFDLMKRKGTALTDQELTPFLDARMRATRSATSAYNVWLQLLPAERLVELRPVNNLDFAQDFSGLPFDWRMARSTNVFINFQPVGQGQDGRILRARFGAGRFTFGPVSQITFLKPGTYRFEGMQNGRMSARRGMRWQVSCFTGNRMIGQSDQLMGAPRDWRAFNFEFTVPDDPACEAQIIRLIHDARSPSEQIASGEIMFDKLNITRKND